MHILLGLAATLLAVIQMAGWLALGSLLTRGSDDGISVAAAVLIGSAFTGFVYAVLAAAGQVSLAIWVVMGISSAAIIWRRRAVRRLAGSVIAAYRDLWRGNRWLQILVVAALMTAWIVAIAPPRDSDVTRYHLAHIRQILADGRWVPLPDYHYALPFGWSLNYLPFESIGLPQGAHMLNLLLWATGIGLLAQVTARYDKRLALLLCAMFAFQPAILKAATTAFADMVLIFAMLGLGLLLVRLPDLRREEFGLLGFAAWIGMQSRYQAMAAGLAATCVLLVYTRRLQQPRNVWLAFGLGSAAALALSSPFYISNWLAFRNPVWPLMVGAFTRSMTYADQVAAAYTASLTGSLDAGTIATGLFRALTSVYVFPIPWLVLVLLLASLRWRLRALIPAALFVAFFLGFWILAQPALYARFFLYLFPPVILGLAPLLAQWIQRPVVRRLVHAGLTLGVAGMIAFGLFYSYDSLAYAATGDLQKYHRFTWFYDVYAWANAATPPDARFLVIVSYGDSYYLDRPYRRADPSFSGVVDWSAINSEQALLDRLRGDGYRYVIYEDAAWQSFPSGGQMAAVIHEAVASGRLAQVADFSVQLADSRVLRLFRTADVRVLEVGDS